MDSQGDQNDRPRPRPRPHPQTAQATAVDSNRIRNRVGTERAVNYALECLETLQPRNPDTLATLVETTPLTCPDEQATKMAALRLLRTYFNQTAVVLERGDG